MAEGYRYVAFISYSHADERLSRWLHRALETYRVPGRLVGQPAQHGPVPARLAPVFRDRDELAGGADLGSTVTAALQESRHLIVICSPAAARSRWVDEEVRVFKRMGRGDRILTLIVDGEPNASDLPGEEDRECFVPSLRFHLDADGGLSDRPAEPVAADMRPGKDGRLNARLKLIATLLGVGLDELKQREHRRQQKRMLAVTAASLAGVLVTGGLAINASLARQDAVRNRDRAEDLIGFMLGDFREELEPIGRLDVLNRVGDKAMAYFSSLGERDITNESLLRRAEALRQIGDVRLSLGDYDAALEAFGDSLDLSRELSGRSPDNQDWLFALGNAWFWVGYSHWQRGDLGAAVGPMNEYLHAAERLVALAPFRLDWQLERSYALGNLGSLAAKRGERRVAIGYFEASNAIVEDLIKGSPGDHGLLASRIENTSWLGSTYEGLGDLREARELHGRALDLTAELLALNPDDRRIQREQVLRQVFYARVLLLMGETEEARRVSGAALEGARVLAAADPDNARWQWQLASVMELESRVRRATGRCAAALAMADEGLAVADALSKMAGEMDLGDLTRLRLLSGRAACLIEEDRLEAAELALGPLLELSGVPGEKSVNASHYEAVLATGRHLAGRVRAGQGRTEEAEEFWTAGLALLDPAATDAGHRAIRAMLLTRLGRDEQAKEVSMALSRQGYAEPEFVRLMAAPGRGR